MAQVHIVRGSGRQWTTVLALVGAAMVTVLWWWSHREDDAAAQHAVAAVEEPAGLMNANKPVSAMVQRVSTEGGSLESQQMAAAHALEQMPRVKAATGPVKERPEFISEMEWSMLKGVAQQSPTPDVELTRLVNKLRFMKQLELWQSLTKPSDAGKRQVLAEELLADLPQRVASADMDKPEAQKLQASLLKDAVTDEQARKSRAEIESRRLVAPAAS